MKTELTASRILRLIERAINPDLKEAHIKAYAERMIEKDRERVRDLHIQEGLSKDAPILEAIKNLPINLD